MRNILIITMMASLPLIAQDFLEGVKAEFLAVDKIEIAPETLVKKIDDEGFDFWDGPELHTAYSCDSTLIAEIRNEKPGGKVIGVWLVDKRRKTERQILNSTISSGLHWSFDGKFLAYRKMVPAKELFHGRQVYQSAGTWIFNLETNEEKQIPISDDYKWSPKGNFLAGNRYSGASGKRDSVDLILYNADISEIMVLDRSVDFEPWNFSWSPDGNMLAYVVASRASGHIELSPIESEVFVINRDGTGRTKLTNTPQPEVLVKWLADGEHIVVDRFKETPYPQTGGGEHEIVILKLKKKERR